MSFSFYEQNPSPLQMLSKSLGQGIGGGLQARNSLNLENERQTLADKLKMVQDERMFQRKKDLFEDFAKTKEFQSLDPLTQKVIAGEHLGIIPAGTGKSILDIQQKQKDMDFLNNLLGGGEGAPSQQAGQQLPSEDGTVSQGGAQSVPESQLQRLSDTQLNQLLAKGGGLGNVAKAEMDRRKQEQEFGLKQKKLTSQEKQFEHSQTSKYAENLVENATQAQEIKHAIGGLRKALKNNASGPSARNVAFKYLSSRHSPLAGLFQTEDTQAIVNAQKVLSGGFRALFGARPTQAEFFWYENILPDLLKSGDVNESVAGYFERVADIQLEAQKVYDDIVKKNAGYRPIDIDTQVRERIKPKTDKLIQEGQELTSYSMVKAPDGSIRKIPKTQLEAALKAGGVEVE